jgi:hypothetical protein
MVALPLEISVVLLSGEELLFRQLSEPCDPLRGFSFETSPSGRIKTYLRFSAAIKAERPLFRTS